MAIGNWLGSALLALGLMSTAQAAAIEASDLEQLDLNGHVSLMEDASRDLGIDEARHAQNYAPAPGGRTSFGFTESAWWVRVPLHNSADTPRELVLRQDYPLIDKLDLWVVRDGAVESHIATGDRLPFNTRAIKHRDFLFPLTLPARSETTLYLRLQTDGAMNIGLSLHRPIALLTRLSREQLAFGLYFGGFFVLIFYNLFIFLAVRDRPFLFYLLYATSYGLYFGIHDGLSFQFLWPDHPDWANTSLLVMLTLTLIFGLLFTRSFLDGPRLAPRLDRAARALQALSILALLASFFVPYRMLIAPVAYLTLAATVVILAMGILGLLRRQVSARYFMIAWAVLLAGVLVYMCKTFGWLPHNALTQNAFQIGSLLEMMLLSLALAHRVRELSHQSRTDPLTQLVNRRAFDETLEREFDRYHKGHGAIALLVADVDHFKQVNDRHGHAYGDKVLRRIADVLRECVDGRDMVGRYGGEEFAVLFPGLNASAAAARAEQIRRAVQERVGDQSSVTISIGVASTDDGGLDSPNALFRAADEALYRAKDLGRNRVVGYAEALPESSPAG